MATCRQTEKVEGIHQFFFDFGNGNENTGVYRTDGTPCVFSLLDACDNVDPASTQPQQPGTYLSAMRLLATGQAANSTNVWTGIRDDQGCFGSSNANWNLSLIHI